MTRFNVQTKSKPYIFLFWLSLFIEPAYASDIETRIFALDHCPATSPIKPKPAPGALAPLVAALVSAAVSPLVNSAVDAAGNAIKNAAKDKSAALPPASDITMDFYQIGSAGDINVNPKFRCITIVRAKFITDSLPVDELLTGSLLEKIKGRLRVPGKGSEATRIDGDPEFYFETSVILGDNKQTFALQPRAVYVKNFYQKNGWFGSDDRSYKISLSFRDLTTNEVFGSTEFEFLGVKANDGKVSCENTEISLSCNGETLGGLHGWLATRPASDNTKNISKNRKADARLIMLGATKEQLKPEDEVPENLDTTKKSLGEYCKEIDIANRSRPDVQKLFPPECPTKLFYARRTLDFARKADQRILDIKEGERILDALSKTSEFAKFCANVADKSSAASCIAKKNETEFSGEFSIAAAIVETKEGSKLAKFLAPTVDSVTPKLKETLIAQLDPVAREKAASAKEEADATAAKASRLAKVSATKAKFDAESAEYKYQKAVESADQLKIIEAQAELVQKQSDANEAYRDAGMPPLYPDL